MRAQVVSFHCVLRNQVGTLLSSTFNHDVITQSAGGEQMLPALAQALQNLKKGEKRQIALTARQAYGLYDPSLVLTVPRKKLPGDEQPYIDQQIWLEDEKGRYRAYRVTEIHAASLTLDGNHPLAGQDLLFEIDTVEARDATDEEIAECSEQLGSTRPLLH